MKHQTAAGTSTDRKKSWALDHDSRHSTFPISDDDDDYSSLSDDDSITSPTSISGKFSNIADKFQINHDRVLSAGGGHGHGSRHHHIPVVKECTHRTTGHQYAVKSILKTSRSIDPANLRRELSLLKELARDPHPNILNLVDVHEDARCLHLVTDLYSGGDLHRKIASSSCAGRGLAEPDASRVLSQVLAALAHLHGRDIVHRDVKPENIAFESPSSSSVVRLVDLGLARKHYRDSFEPYMSTLAGTSRFVAPEVLRRKYDRRCDAWSAGAVAFFALAGRLPFDGKDDAEARNAVRAGRYQFRSGEWKDVSGEAKDFVSRLLRANPKKRMSIEQAMGHPWMVKRDGVGPQDGEDQKNGSCVKMASIKVERKDSVLSFRDVARRKVRLSVFCRQSV